MKLCDHPIPDTCAILQDGDGPELLAFLNGVRGLPIAITSSSGKSETYSLRRADDAAGVRYLLLKWDNDGTTYTVRPPGRFRQFPTCDCPDYTYRQVKVLGECKHIASTRVIVNSVYGR